MSDKSKNIDNKNTKEEKPVIGETQPEKLPQHTLL